MSRTKKSERKIAFRQSLLFGGTEIVYAQKRSLTVRSRVVPCRMTEAQFEIVAARAGREGVSVSRFLTESAFQMAVVTASKRSRPGVVSRGGR